MTSDGYDVYHQTTEWEDALAKHKIIEKRKKPISNDVLDTKAMWEEKEKDPYADKTLEDLQELEDEIDEDVCSIYVTFISEIDIDTVFPLYIPYAILRLNAFTFSMYFEPVCDHFRN